MAVVDQLDRLDLGEVRVGDDHLVDPFRVEHVLQPRERAKRAKAIRGQLRRGEKPDDLDRRVLGVGERVGDVPDVLARADEHRAAAVAGGAQQRPRQPLVEPAQRGHVQKRKSQRPPEDVEAREVFPAHDGEQQRDERDLEQRADDP